jgi:hypothetical protein
MRSILQIYSNVNFWQKFFGAILGSYSHMDRLSPTTLLEGLVNENVLEK